MSFGRYGGGNNFPGGMGGMGGMRGGPMGGGMGGRGGSPFGGGGGSPFMGGRNSPFGGGGPGGMMGGNPMGRGGNPMGRGGPGGRSPYGDGGLGGRPGSPFGGGGRDGMSPSRFGGLGGRSGYGGLGDRGRQGLGGMGDRGRQGLGGMGDRGRPGFGGMGDRGRPGFGGMGDRPGGYGGLGSRNPMGGLGDRSRLGGMGNSGIGGGYNSPYGGSSGLGGQRGGYGDNSNGSGYLMPGQFPVEDSGYGGAAGGANNGSMYGNRASPYSKGLGLGSYGNYPLTQRDGLSPARSLGGSGGSDSLNRSPVRDPRVLTPGRYGQGSMADDRFGSLRRIDPDTYHTRHGGSPARPEFAKGNYPLTMRDRENVGSDLLGKGTYGGNDGQGIVRRSPIVIRDRNPLQENNMNSPSFGGGGYMDDKMGGYPEHRLLDQNQGGVGGLGLGGQDAYRPRTLGGY